MFSPSFPYSKLNAYEMVITHTPRCAAEADGKSAGSEIKVPVPVPLIAAHLSY